MVFTEDELELAEGKFPRSGEMDGTGEFPSVGNGTASNSAAVAHVAVSLLHASCRRAGIAVDPGVPWCNALRFRRTMRRWASP